MNAVCHIQFEQTAIIALLVVAFALTIAATLALLHFRIVNQKLDRVMRAMKLNPDDDEFQLHPWLKKIGGVK